MDEKTLTALQASIEHWRKNETVPMERVTLGVHDCALCGLFNNDSHTYENRCRGCPVSFVGYRLCAGSPYDEVDDAWNSWEEQIGEGNVDEAKACEKEFRYAALRERVFLESLLPKEDLSIKF